MKQANRYRPSKKEVDIQEWIKNRIALRITPHVKKPDRRKMDRWMRKLLKTDMMKDIVRGMEWRAKLTTDENPYIFKP